MKVENVYLRLFFFKAVRTSANENVRTNEPTGMQSARLSSEIFLLQKRRYR